MSLFYASINSGSNGNCYYVGNSNEAVLVDVGISCREVEQRMNKMGLSIHSVKAIFISHEHTDHIKGVSVLAKKYKLPVYITRKTRRHWIKGLQHLFVDFEANEPIVIGELIVTPFAKHHDALDPHSFIISYKGITVGVFTDIGQVCEDVIHYFKQCHAIFLESNYDEMMLENGSYPLLLKNRIRSGQGHLSNREALELFKMHKPHFMQHVLLSHLSKENNSPELAEKLFLESAQNTVITIASRYEPSAVYRLDTTLIDIASIVAERKKSPLMRIMQLLLFE